MNLIQQAFTYFIPSDLKKDPIVYSHAKNIVTSGLIAIFAVPAYAMVYYKLGWPFGAELILIFGGLIIANVASFKIFKSIEIVREVFVGLLFVLLVWLSYGLGGINTPAIFWLILLPLLITIFGGKTTAYFWSFASVTAIVVLFLLEYLHVTLPVNPVSDILSLQVISVAGLVIIVSWITYFFERGKREAATQIQETSKRLREKENIELMAKSAIEANQAKSEFIASMSHEIRTPLNGVIGMTNLLHDLQLSPQQREYTEIIRVSSEALLAVVNNILDFSKIEAGQLELEQTGFSLPDLVETAIRIVHSQAYKKGNVIHSQIDSNLPRYLLGDQVKIRQVIINLLMNAVKFTENGRITIDVKIYKQENNKFILLVEVIDTGIGMDAEVCKRLFNPYFQADSSITRKYGGTGLGLTISKKLVELMEGQIGVDSTVGVGSKFWFTIALTEGAYPDLEDEYKNLASLVNMRVLCIDDDEINLEVVKRQTEFWKMRCDVTRDASEALFLLKKAVMEKNPYDVMLIDYVMPKMSGVDLVFTLRQFSDIAKTPVILFSSIDRTSEEENLKQLGIYALMVKPLRKNKLYELFYQLSKNKISETSTELTRKSIRILLADDNLVNQKVAVKMLEKLGYHADVVSNGVEVLDKLKTKLYDILLLDCRMPEMDGYEAARQIRKLDSVLQRNMIIVAMTAGALKEDKDKCIAAGMNDYLTKPIDLQSLSAVLETYTKKINHSLT